MNQRGLFMARKNNRNKQSREQVEKMYKRYVSKFKAGEAHLDAGDFAEELRKRRKYKSHDIVMDIVRDTKYDISAKQARELRKAMERYNSMVDESERIKAPSIRDIRKGKLPDEFKSAISQRYHALVQSGYSTDAASDVISQEYFGSPE